MVGHLAGFKRPERPPEDGWVGPFFWASGYSIQTRAEVHSAANPTKKEDPINPMSDFTDWQVTEWLEHKEESGGIRVLIKVLCYVVAAQVTATVTLAAAFIQRG